ncbi:MAG: glycine--tRNA ligase [bacterium]|nr:glycine--tRNA ligase [bacterium]
MSTDITRMESIVSLAKRRGFIFPTAEKYGGLGGFWDWGALGVEFKNNIKQAWWKKFVQGRRDVVGLDSAIVTNPTVWEKSGHLKGFTDSLIECKKCHKRYKADDLHPPGKAGRSCPNCDSMEFSDERAFNTMFKTFVGPVEDSASIAYLRPETAQNIFVNFESVQTSSRLKLPFGIAQIGKAFRNEITPGNFIFRSREFEQMELEYFVKPGEDSKWFEYWVEEAYQWFIGLGIKKEHLRKHPQSKGELAHYAKATVDLEYRWPFSTSGGDEGWSELIGVANRGDFDLKAHGFSVKDETGEFVPYVIEPSFGVERPALAFLLDSYDVVKGGRTTTTESNKEEEIVLRLHKSLAPVKVAVLPLSKKEPLVKEAGKIFEEIASRFACAYDDTASIGRRYRRQDEIGTPYCLTVDFETLEDKKVTIRDRDTMEQERVAVEELTIYLTEKFNAFS